MKIKFQNIYKGDSLIITQTAHGKGQGNKAWDFVGSDSQEIIAPISGRVEDMGSAGSGQKGDKYFRLHFSNGFIEFVHNRCTITGNVKVGQIIGIPTYNPIHSHVAVFYENKWQEFLPFLDRKYKLKQSTNFTWQSKKWENWSTYEDKYIILNNNTMNIYDKFVQKYRSDHEAIIKMGSEKWLKEFGNYLLWHSIGRMDRDDVKKAYENRTQELYKWFVNDFPKEKHDFNPFNPPLKTKTIIKEVGGIIPENYEQYKSDSLVLSRIKELIE